MQGHCCPDRVTLSSFSEVFPTWAPDINGTWFSLPECCVDSRVCNVS